MVHERPEMKHRIGSRHNSPIDQRKQNKIYNNMNKNFDYITSHSYIFMYQFKKRRFTFLKI